MRALEEGSVHMPVTGLAGVGPATAKNLEKLGVTDIYSLLKLIPRTYEDRTKLKTIAELQEGEAVCVRVTATTTPTSSYVRGRSIVRVRVADETGRMTLFFFNATYMADHISRGETYLVYGKVRQTARDFSMINPVTESLEGAEDDPNFVSAKMGMLMPVYPLTGGLTQTSLRRIVKKALPWVEQTPEVLPEIVRENWGLMSAANALRQMHNPEDEQLLKKAKYRMAFEELYLLAMALRLRRDENAGDPGAVLPHCDMSPFYAALPYELTNAQKRVIVECLSDMRRGSPAMHRLVQGDVGSGKTAVAAACAYAGKCAGWQTAMMAPTEILAEQHYQSLSALLGPLGVRVELLKGSMKAAERRRALEAIAMGMADLIVGTHALLSEGVEYFDLRLAITDEQHRFGVQQRAKLVQKGKAGDLSPHILVMSATPIPRTLALMLYGDLDLSALDELPPGRQPIQTRILSEQSRMKAYGFMNSLFEKGRQCYVVCPHIEDGDMSDVTSVEQRTKELSEVFPQYRVEALHGKMKPAEKDRVMRDFSEGKITILVSTTVIEVGVNVPNAAVMVIENAERFGLAQLHQLRGRVGRGKEESFCILFSDSQNQETRARLEALRSSNDGFKLAQEDLRLRGPGDFLGVRQSGLPALHSAELGADMNLLTDMQDAVHMTLTADPTLEDFPELKAELERIMSNCSVE